MTINLLICNLLSNKFKTCPTGDFFAHRFHKIITKLSYFHHKLLLHYKMIEMPLDSPILCFIQGHFLLNDQEEETFFQRLNLIYIKGK